MQGNIVYRQLCQNKPGLGRDGGGGSGPGCDLGCLHCCSFLLYGGGELKTLLSARFVGGIGVEDSAFLSGGVLNQVVGGS